MAFDLYSTQTIYPSGDAADISIEKQAPPVSQGPNAVVSPSLMSLSSSASSSARGSTKGDDESSDVDEDVVVVEEEMTMDFMDCLYNYSGLLRMVPLRPLPPVLLPMHWYPLEIHLANELGSLLPSTDALDALKLDCVLLERRTSHMDALQPSTQWRLVWQPVSKRDNWDSDRHFHLQVMIKPLARQKVVYTTAAAAAAAATIPSSSLMVMITPTAQLHSLHVLPLVTAPFQISSSSTRITKHHAEHRAWTSYASLVMYRGYSLPSKHDYFLIKEGWVHGTPGKMWDSALVVSDAVVRQLLPLPSTSSKPRILDLSAGTGVIGLLMAFQCQRGHSRPMHITLTDVPEALGLIHENRRLNGITYEDVAISALRWGHPADMGAMAATGLFDVIIASDVLYEPDKFPLLVATLHRLASMDTKILVGYKRRGLKLEDEQFFFDLARPLFHVHQQPLDRRHGHALGWLGPHAQKHIKTDDASSHLSDVQLFLLEKVAS
ncbi:putative methyltransferase-domain-containing protein [Gongronella butleri]|nr:putative methyltransferase-domain-containing protein [Gongronella butleri]